MDILTEIRIWGARYDNAGYWGYGAYTQFAQELSEGKSIYLESGLATLVQYEAPNEYDESDQTLQLVFKVDDRIYAMDGEYSSWNGTTWSGLLYEVEAKPIQKVSYVRKR